MNVTALLTAYCSRRDSNGNVYWAFEFRETDSGQTVCGTISGGESNIKAIMFGWSIENEWDRSIIYRCEQLPIREFNRMTKGLPYAGCRREEIVSFIKERLS